MDAGTLYTLPAALKPSSFCAVKFLLDFEDGITTTIDGTYFRAVNEQSLLTYDIQKLDYQGLPVYRQIGDMSAGFGVLKTIVAFDQGIAATMEEAPQGGTYPVAPTPEFLQRSVRKTVELYNSEIGAATKIKRVVAVSYTHLPNWQKHSSYPIMRNYVNQSIVSVTEQCRTGNIIWMLLPMMERAILPTRMGS